MVSYLGSVVQFSPAAGRAALQADVAVCGEHSPCSGHTGFAPYRAVCAFPVYTAQVPGCSVWSGPCVVCGSSFRVLHKSAGSVAPACCVFPGLSAPGSLGLGRPLPGRGAPFPSAAPARALLWNFKTTTILKFIAFQKDFGSHPLPALIKLIKESYFFFLRKLFL